MQIFPFTISLLSSADEPTTARVTRETLSQQTLMELFLNNPYSDIGYTDDGNAKVLKYWHNVYRNKAGDVVEIRWAEEPNFAFDARQRVAQAATQPILLEWLPYTVRVLSIWRLRVQKFDANFIPLQAQRITLDNCSMEGTLETADLPSGLRDLSLSANALKGTVDLTQLPKKLRFLTLSKNSFSGGIDCSRLPFELESLDLSNNLFCGNLKIPMYCGAEREMPGVMFIHHNYFHGAIIYTGSQVNRLFQGRDTQKYNHPAFLYCVANEFTSIDWESLLPVIQLDASRNSLEGHLDTKEISRYMQYLNLNTNRLSGSIDLTSFTQCFLSLHEFSAAHNALSGTICLDFLPPNLQQIDLSHNQLTGVIKIGFTAPHTILLQSNAFEGLEIGAKLNESIMDVSVADNAIKTEAVAFGQIPFGLYVFDLRGNSIAKCVGADGEALEDPRIKYDEGNAEQRQGYLNKRRWTEIA